MTVLSRRCLVCLAPVLLTAVAGCTALGLLATTSLKKPQIRYQEHRLGQATLTQVHAEITLMAENPNAIGLKNVFVNYELFIQGHRFMTGKDVQVTLAPQAVTLIQVPADIVYSDLLAALGPTALDILQGRKTLPVDVHLTVRGEPTLYDDQKEGALLAFSFNLDRSIEVPVPRLDDALSKARNRLKGLLSPP